MHGGKVRFYLFSFHFLYPPFFLCCSQRHTHHVCRHTQPRPQTKLNQKAAATTTASTEICISMRFTCFAENQNARRFSFNQRDWEWLKMRLRMGTSLRLRSLRPIKPLRRLERRDVSKALFTYNPHTMLRDLTLHKLDNKLLSTGCTLNK